MPEIKKEELPKHKAVNHKKEEEGLGGTNAGGSASIAAKRSSSAGKRKEVKLGGEDRGNEWEPERSIYMPRGPNKG